MSNNCRVVESADIGKSYNYLRFVDPAQCGEVVIYYGESCQMMEVEGVSNNVRGAATRRVTINKDTGEACDIGVSRGTPDLTQVTVRMKEICGPGIPLSERLKQCQFYVIITHGGCVNRGDFLTGWGDYVEVLCLDYVSDSLGRRTSFDLSDDERVIEITADLRQRNLYSSIVFSPIDLTDECTPENITAEHGAFACNTGCNEVRCGCQESCDDGTQSFYIPMQCTGGNSQLVTYSINGGNDTDTLVMPLANDGGTPAANPDAVIIGQRLYVLAYEDPTELWVLNLDGFNSPNSGTWTHLYTLTDGAITTGTPGRLIQEQGALHILVEDAANGARTYLLSGSGLRTPDAGPRETFDPADMITEIATCGTTVLVGGANGVLYISRDGGSNYNSLVSPTGNTITAVALNGSDYWIGNADGNIWYTSNNGVTWTQVNIQDTTGQINDIQFVDNSTIWIATASGGVFSTWSGGKNGLYWTNDRPRFDNFPEDFTPLRVVTPQCAAQHLQDNTFLMIGVNGAGETQAYIGRAGYSGYII